MRVLIVEHLAAGSGTRTGCAPRILALCRSVAEKQRSTCCGRRKLISFSLMPSLPIVTVTRFCAALEVVDQMCQSS